MIFIFDILLIGLAIGTVGSIMAPSAAEGTLSTRFGYTTPSYRQF